jgi:hypothetical protein
LKILPDPFTVEKVTVGPNRSFSNSQDDSHRLSPGERADVRLRLNRTISYLIPYANRANTYRMFNARGEENRPAGSTFYRLGYNHEWEPKPDAFGVTLRQEVPNRLKPGHLDFDASVLNASVSLEPESRPSNADAPVAAPGGGDPATPVPPQPALSVGALVKRVGQVTRVELYADPRVAAQPVWALGDSARAGDVLKALCYAVTGTFRRVGPSGDNRPAFVLADDIAGIGARRARLAEWAQDAQSEDEKTREALDNRIRGLKPAQYIGFAPDDPLTLGEDVVRALRQKRFGPRKPGDDGNTPVSELPPAHQAMLREYMLRQAAASSNDEYSRNNPLNGDRVSVSVETRAGYLVPGVGSIDDQTLQLWRVDNVINRDEEEAARRPAPPAPPPATLPSSLRTRALLVTVKNANEAERAAAEAKRRKLTHLWIDLGADHGKTSNTEEAAALLAGAVQAGAKHGLPVSAVVRLFPVKSDPDTGPDAGGGETADLSPEVNIFGETASAYAARRLAAPAFRNSPWMRERLRPGEDWLRADNPQTLARLKRRLTALASVPGLAGLVLEDTAAPGYGDPGTTSERSGYFSDRGDYGYSSEARLRFLRAENIDPIDLLPPNSYVNNADLSLPFFADQILQPRMIQSNGRWIEQPGFRSVTQKWRAFRYQANAKLMADLYAALRQKARSDLSLVLHDRSDGYAEAAWFGSWDKPDALPRSAPRNWDDPNPVTPANTARTYSRQILLHAPYRFADVTRAAPGTTNETPEPDEPKKAEIARRNFAGFLGYLMAQQKSGWDGIVLDLSESPIERVLPLLAVLDTPVPANTTVAAVKR